MEIKAYDMALAFQRGEEKGFTYFFDLLRPRLQYFAFRILKDEDDAADAVEDGFIKIWADHEIFNHPKVISSWLYTTVRNRCFAILAKRKTALKYEKELVLLSANDVEESKENQIIRAETIGLIYEGMKHLPDSCREIFRLIYINGLTVNEVSKKLNCSLSNIKTQKWVALKILKEITEFGMRKKRQPCIVDNYNEVGYEAYCENPSISTRQLQEITGLSYSPALRMLKRFKNKSLSYNKV